MSPEAALSGGPDERQRSEEAVPLPLDLLALGAAVAQGPHNQVVMAGHGHRARLTLTTSQGPWHHHPNTPETFIVLEGVLVLDFRDGSSARLRPGMSLSVPAGVSHRSRCEPLTGGRALSISLEVQDQQVILEPEAPETPPPEEP